MVNGHRLRIYYGNIVGQPYYKSYMNLVDSSRPYYARNSKGKIVPIHEVGWDSPLATPTHIIMMFSAGCGTAYEALSVRIYTSTTWRLSTTKPTRL